MALPPRCRRATALLLAAMLAGCGEGEQRADPEAVDSHLNQIIAREAAERDKLVAEARAREAVREQEMEEKTANYANSAD